MRQGPHQGAQKSTTTGNWLRPVCLAKLSLSSATGSPVTSGWWQLPQSG